MPTPFVSLALVAAAAAADGADRHHLAFYLVLLAIPPAAAAAFVAAVDFLERRCGVIAAVASALVVVLLVLGSAVRSNAAEGTPVPQVALTALLACLVVYGVQAVVWLVRPLVPARATAAAPD